MPVQDRQDFLALPGPLPGQDFRIDALAEAPEQQGPLGIDRPGSTLLRHLDQCPNLAQQLSMPRLA